MTYYPQANDAEIAEAATMIPALLKLARELETPVTSIEIVEDDPSGIWSLRAVVRIAEDAGWLWLAPSGGWVLEADNGEFLTDGHINA